jgi:hypothetical protein
MLSHSVRRNLPKLLAAPQSGLFLLRLGPGGSGGLPERGLPGSARAMSSETCLAPREAGIFLPRCFPCASQSCLWDDGVRSTLVMAGVSKPYPLRISQRVCVQGLIRTSHRTRLTPKISAQLVPSFWCMDRERPLCSAQLSSAQCRIDPLWSF